MANNKTQSKPDKRMRVAYIGEGTLEEYEAANAAANAARRKARDDELKAKGIDVAVSKSQRDPHEVYQFQNDVYVANIHGVSRYESSATGVLGANESKHWIADIVVRFILRLVGESRLLSNHSEFKSIEKVNNKERQTK